MRTIIVDIPTPLQGTAPWVQAVSRLDWIDRFTQVSSYALITVDSYRTIAANILRREGQRSTRLLMEARVHDIQYAAPDIRHAQLYIVTEPFQVPFTQVLEYLLRQSRRFAFRGSYLFFDTFPRSSSSSSGPRLNHPFTM